MKCHWCAYPICFVAYWLDFGEVEGRRFKFPACQICYKDIRLKYTCKQDKSGKCIWPAEMYMLEDSSDFTPLCKEHAVEFRVA